MKTKHLIVPLLFLPILAFILNIYKNHQITETGQPVFAAIAEITNALMNDGNTDWDSVDIDGLRDHLLDMDMVTMNANASGLAGDSGVLFTVTGDEKTAAAIKRMSQAHMPMLEADTGWETSVTLTENGAQVSVKPDNKSEVEKIRALGFFGLLTIGAHHQHHHLQLARGHSAH